MHSATTTRKIIVLALGSDGDINPMIAIATQLQMQGRKVEFLASGYFEERVKQAGLDFCPVGDRSLYERALKQKDVWHPYNAFKAMWKIMSETIPITYEVLKSRYAPGDLVVGTSLALAARMLQEKSGAKFVSVHLQPSITISAYTPPVGPPGALPKGLPLPLKQLYVNMLDRFLLDAACRDDLNRFRQTIGLPPIKSIFTKWIHSPNLVIMAWPEWFAPPQPDWPENSLCTAFPVFEHGSTAEISEETAAFLKAGSAPIIFTAGSAMAQGAEHFSCAAEALRNQPLRGIFVCKFRETLPSNLPPNIHHSSYEPFDKLFPLASAVQHHGGIGTSIQAMLAGKPQLVTPFAHDQFDNAVRLEELGIAKTMRTKNSNMWRRKLMNLLANPKTQVACEQIKNRLLSDGRPIETITNQILRLE